MAVHRAIPLEALFKAALEVMAPTSLFAKALCPGADLNGLAPGVSPAAAASVRQQLNTLCPALGRAKEEQRHFANGRAKQPPVGSPLHCPLK